MLPFRALHKKPKFKYANLELYYFFNGRET
jgi:hypothetical protein